MPAVREPSDGPEPLEVVEVRPGVRLKLNAADKKAMLAAQSADEQRQREWTLINAQGASTPTKEVPLAGPAVDGPIDSAPAANADETAVVAAPKRTTRTKKS